MSGRRSLATVLALLVLTGFSFWLLTEVRSPPHAPSSGPAPPRYFMTDATLEHWNQKGRMVYWLHALLIEHLPERGLYALTKPDLIDHHGPDTIWSVRARHGLLNETKNRLVLWHKVRGRQRASLHHPPLRLMTSRLTVFLKTRQAESTRRVTLSTGAGYMVGTGLSLDLNQGWLILRSRVHGLLLPVAGRQVHPKPVAPSA